MWLLFYHSSIISRIKYYLLSTKSISFQHVLCVCCIAFRLQRIILLLLLLDYHYYYYQCIILYLGNQRHIGFSLYPGRGIYVFFKVQKIHASSQHQQTISVRADDMWYLHFTVNNNSRALIHSRDVYNLTWGEVVIWSVCCMKRFFNRML